MTTVLATAAADPIDSRNDLTPQVEAGSPAAQNGAAASEPGLTPGPHAAQRSGNPLWTVSLTALAATRDRPLFSASRRPPVVAVPTVAPPPQSEAAAPPPPERPLLTLIGTIVSPKTTLAMLQGSNADSVLRLRVGQENDGWLVRGISLRSIVVEKGEQSVELALPRSNGAPPE
jgi:hypothetical protein